MKVFGKGINDTENAKDYQTWHSMLRRCYSPVFKKDKPTYEGCEVCEEWLHCGRKYEECTSKEDS